ncbi:G-type lectin S-receptor-like serine/threonine-protein kinase LECRK3 [Cinnamomum micranthum f. kanehirae]|uniref:G-type lectin S-receptor-like serine/threonine-protein kinase LECRK3 n=1 Tax=Cinnamomum micranthum f. kanehirae TaxID=337451 RepID=A0A443Q218_9MAGN|nr:G-type lectin S-receptor-like serine/threonine-protein kinase LECRK3 [Cinnamomum micranthum f. kanehirae]
MTLSSRNQLISSASETNHSSGRFRLKNQDDGNLVLYPVDTTDIAENAYWASGIFDQGYRPTLALDEDGHMYLFREDGKIVRNFTDGWTSRNQTVFYRATIDFDGIFRLYSHSICGFNSYCSSEDNRTGCLCLPGFDFVDPLQRFRGCERNFTEQSCGDRTDNLTYVMQTMENMVLEDDPYSISQVGNMDDCGKACLYDCTCHASLLRSWRCSKLKLPLRYGRRGTDNSTMIFIKVGDGTLESPNRTFPTGTEMRSKKMIRMDILAVSIALVTCSVIAILISCLLIYRYHRRSKTISQKEDFWIDGRDYFEIVFLRRAQKKATGNFKEELDVDKAVVDRMVKVGLWCIQNEPGLRPSIKNVILMLEGNMDIPIPPSNSF